MWVQIIKSRVPEQNIEAMTALDRRVRDAMSGTDSKPMRVYRLRNQKDPEEYYVVVVFESEEKARANERSPAIQEFAGEMSKLVSGPPEFLDLDLVDEYEP